MKNEHELYWRTLQNGSDQAMKQDFSGDTTSFNFRKVDQWQLNDFSASNKKWLVIPRILHQFRMGTVAICGDIAEMFCQIKIRPDDKQAQRFLWRRGDKTKPIDTYVMDSITFGASCSPCSAHFVKNHNAREFSSQFNDAAAAIIEKHYMDDYVCSFDNEEDAIRVTKDIIHIHEKGGFELRSFVFNSQNVLTALGCNAKQTIVKIPNDSTTCADNWKCFGTQPTTISPLNSNLKEFTPKRAPTKREILSVTMSTFDPFGIVADFTIYAKILIQDLWKTGLGWDDPVNDDILIRWRKWFLELQNISLCKIPRCYSSTLRTTDDLQIHIFADASEYSFACVSCWRLKRADDEYEVSFIAGKSRCAPQKLLSVPRLELQAAVLATRLCESIKKSHEGLRLKKIVFWSDSSTVINWIRSDHRKYKPFVAHRIAEILDSTDVKNWRWIPTKLNVADDATRATNVRSFFKNLKMIGQWKS